MLIFAIVALFTLEGHDAPISTLTVIGAGMVVCATILPRLGDKIEFGPKGLSANLRKLDNSVTKAQEHLPAYAKTSTSLKKETAASKREGVVSAPSKIVELAAISPRAAAIQLAIQIEQATRVLLAQMGHGDGSLQGTFLSLVHNAEKRNALPQSLTDSLEVFWRLRSSIVHGENVSKEKVLGFIDSGVSILKMLESIPHETNVVYHPGVTLYADEKCKTVLPGKGLILETISPGGTKKAKRISPTMRTDYKRGQVLSWEWSFERIWDAAWYKDPDTSEVKPAWLGSAEFIGRPLKIDPPI